ncbi:MAG: bifunctional 23S rRNA (guanine(2069)-N(7))-methyltransferase RlmK/23S rRNA (guanine(2445)-N(2))-methyltransferase RlmL [Pseudomonadota bacterium]|nr:bifunctional 23S rRNA (guanine(2069)-N(7))-methyltransferase RlmK/23S rRNA (guanine(2445)-N(2))-methyltransferase RlmL [Pseudomonadota bacterium]
MNTQLQFFATVPKGMVASLLAELPALGAEAVREQPAGVEFKGSMETAYRVCLWSRTAGRVLLPLASFAVDSEESLYAGVQTIDWSTHFDVHTTFAVAFTGRSDAIRHTQFGALKIKDGIVDQFRLATGERPSVNLEQPDIRINAHLHHDKLTISLDLSGESLHRRHYRVESVTAPLKENLAAAILLRSGWPEVAVAGGSFVDPMCGSGTLVIEAAMIAADIAPGLLRNHYGFFASRQHDTDLWQRLIDDAEARRSQGLERLPAIYGYDIDPRAVFAAQANVTAAGLDDYIRIARRGLDELVRPAGATAGLLAVNPPYGERLGEEAELVHLYAQLGAKMKEQFNGWQAAVLTGNPDLAKQMGIRARHSHNMFNGALECKLLRFELDPQWYITLGRGPRPARLEELGPGAEMLANRLRKNIKELGRWAEREGISCYRLYDADMPEYNLAIDLYHGEKLWVHVQEYEAPKTIEEEKAKTRLKEALAVIPMVLELPYEQLFLKVRQRQKGASQYEKLAESKEFHEVEESGLTFLVNFSDYLDTGLFLDHRITRRKLRELAGDKDFLNLFGYTGSASVYAAAGGAKSTTTVDMSNTYLDWAKRNMALNGFKGRDHNFVQADCLQWLAEQASSPWGRRYGLIFLDPPTFSSSKRMQQTFDVQRDYIELLRHAIKLLQPDGRLIFSNNNRRFRFDAAALADTGVVVEEISSATIPRDYARNPRIHVCWMLHKPQ